MFQTFRQGKLLWGWSEEEQKWKCAEFSSENAAKKANGLNQRILRKGHSLPDYGRAQS